MRIALGWNGESGYCSYDNRYGVIQVKPEFSFTYDTLNYSTDPNAANYKVKNRLLYALTAGEIVEITDYAFAGADKPVPDLAGGLLLSQEQDAWLEERKDDPRFLPEAKVWLTEREDDPQFSPELKDWLTVRGDDPRFTAALANWLAERQDDPRFTSARSSQVDTLRSDVNALAGRMHTVETAPIDAVRVPLKTLVMLTSPLQPAQVRLLNYIAFRGSSNGQIALPIVLPASTDQATLDAQEAVRVGHELTISNASASRTLTVSKGNSTFWSFDWATIGTTTTLKANEVIQLIAVRDVATNTNGWHMSMRTLNRIN